MTLPLSLDFPPMEAELVGELPAGDGWLFEPKWDGFRCVVFRDGDTVALQSKRGQPLARYFPEVVDAVLQLPAQRFVLDGELVVAVDGHLSFDDLLQRIHPAASRIARLATERPAALIVFDLLVDDHGDSLVELPLRERRQRLESFARQHLDGHPGVQLSPASSDPADAEVWLSGAGDAVDGVMAKPLDQPYRSGERAMLKVKRVRAADCIVGGFRVAAGGDAIASLLLGLHDADGLLNHVGFCSSLSARQRQALLPQLRGLEASPGFTGRAPGGPSRWSRNRETAWVPLAPQLVVEVGYDHFNSGRFRHGTRFMRWRPDKPSSACTMAQVEREARVAPEQLLAPRRRSVSARAVSAPRVRNRLR